MKISKETNATNGKSVVEETSLAKKDGSDEQEDYDGDGSSREKTEEAVNDKNEFLEDWEELWKGLGHRTAPHFAKICGRH